MQLFSGRVLLALVLLNFLLAPNQNTCSSFQCSFTIVAKFGNGRVRSSLDLSTPSSTSRRKAHRKEGADIADAADFVSGAPVLSRRSAFSALAVALPLSADAKKHRANAAAAVALGGATQSARVASWPGVESLEPLYEFKLSLDAIALGVRDRDKWPYIKKRLDAFSGGFILNEKNFFMGVGLQYMNEIQYDGAELPNYVLLDKETRFGALEQTMKNLEDLKAALADTTSTSETVEGLAQASQSSLQAFFALVPESDVKAVEDLFVHVKKADMNGDGALSDEEIMFLPPIEQEIWKRRVKKF